MANKKPFYWRNIIGDGKLPNRYFVFHYDQLHKREKQEDGSMLLDMLKEADETEDSFLGEFKTFEEAMQCITENAYLPHSVIEDRLSGQIWESITIVCPHCGKRDYETYKDTAFTESKMRELGKEFK